MIKATGLLLLLALPGGAQAPPAGSAAANQAVEAMYKAKQWKGLVEYLDKAPAAVRGEHRYELLAALSLTGDWKRVLDACDEALLLGPRSGIPTFTLRSCKGRALRELGLHTQALEFYRAGGKDGNVSDNLDACNEAVTLGDWKALLECAETALDKHPTDGNFLGIKGEALANLGRYGEAEEALNEGVHLAPKRSMSWADLACCYNEQAKYQEAFEAASRAVTLDPRIMEGWYNRGRACIGLKRYQEGRNDFAAALALNPRDPAVAANLKLNISMADKFLAYKPAKPARRGSAVR